MKKQVSAFVILIFALCACREAKHPPTQDIAVSPEQLDEKAQDNIRIVLEYSSSNSGDMGDSVFLVNGALLDPVYERNKYASLWSGKEQWTALADSLFNFIGSAKQYGLFPDDYHFLQLNLIRSRFQRDSLSRRDALLWAKADLMLSDAFMQMVKHLKLGRLAKDSVSHRVDSVLIDSFYIAKLDEFTKSGTLSPVLQSLEPKHKGYQQLRYAVRSFLDSADDREFTIVPSKGKDTIAYRKALQRRLYEGGYIAFDSVAADSSELSAAVKRFQKKKNLTVDGKAGEGTIRALNFTDKEKFLRIAITMDRYKLMGDTMPARYVWVNLPSFNMQLMDADTIKIASRIICGKPRTRTPLLSSALSEMITYPQWTVPASIIEKEILPAAKKDPGYFSSKGFSLVDKDGNEVDPYTVEWTKYKKGIPYKVVQGSGDDNALGILKFNFNNKYAVYLHDTNQRYLFARANRSLSHGCVRVQEWQKLAEALLRFDNPDDKKFQVKLDSMNSWLSRKEKHSIPFKTRVPVYLRYFSCEAKGDAIVFYEDIYGEDKILREKHFARK